MHLDGVGLSLNYRTWTNKAERLSERRRLLCSNRRNVIFGYGADAWAFMR